MTTPARKLELRKIHHSPSLSEETEAYTADLYVDGKLLCHVSNRGHGGSDEQHPAKGRTHAEIAELAEYIKATYPAKDTGMMLEGKPFITEQDLESVCGDLLADHLTEKDIKRLLNRTVAFYDPATNTVRSYKGKIVGDDAIRVIAQTMKKFPNAIILNNAPREQAIALYRKAA